MFLSAHASSWDKMRSRKAGLCMLGMFIGKDRDPIIRDHV